MNPFLVHHRMAHRRSWGQRMVLVFNFVLITSCLLVAASLGYGAQRAASINRVALDRSLTALPEGGSGDRVVNILLVGSDSSANLDPDDPIQIGRQGERLGDVIIVAHLDERDGSVSLLSFPRDLWVPIAGTDRQDRINRAFMIGGPATLIDTIQENFGIPIHHYVNVDFAGFQGLVEAVGTVEVYFETPARDWNVNAEPEPRSQTGFLMTDTGCQSLGPEQALAYVRSRYYQVQNADGEWETDRSSDLGRIRRQQDFLRRLLQKAIALGARNPLVLRDLIDTGVRNVAIDGQLTAGLLIDISGTYRNFDPADLQSFTFPVEDATIGSSRVLRPRTGEAGPLLALFAGERADHPDTVAVELVHDPSLAPPGPEPSGSDLVATVAGRLTSAGFGLGPSGGAGDRAGIVFDQEAVDPGLWIRHGPGGRTAAELVARSLTVSRPEGEERFVALVEPTLVEDAGLGGRDVVVAVGPTPSAPSEPASPAASGDGAPDHSTGDPAVEDNQSRPHPQACQ